MDKQVTYEWQYTGADVAGEPDTRKAPDSRASRCEDCGAPIDLKRGKICKACRDYRKAFTENKYGELA